MHVIFNRIKAFGENLYEIRSSEKIEVVKIDEMDTYAREPKLRMGMDCC